MLFDEVAGPAVLFFAKFFAHFVVARFICRSYKDPRPKEFAVAMIRTGVGLLLGLSYAPILERYGFTPWSTPPQTLIFLAGMIPFSGLVWWWCVMWYFERASMRHEKPLGKSVLLGTVVSALCDMIGLLPILAVKRVWIV